MERGGGIVATHETSLYDEWGVRRPDFGLADLFGASFDGRIDARMQNSYLRLEPDPGTGPRHPILAGLEDAERIINGVSRVHTRGLGVLSNPPLTLIPSYPDLPMEEVFPRVPKTDIPEVYVREPGQDAWSISPGISIALSGTSSRPTMRTAAERRGLGRQRASPGGGDRPGRIGCHHLAAEACL